MRIGDLRSDYKYLRVQGRELAENTRIGRGIFSICTQLLRDDVMEEEDADLFREIDQWFSEVLPYPEVCQRQEKVICYFRTDKTDELIRLIQPAMRLLDKYKHPYDVILTNYPGEIVYEDIFQVAVKVPEQVVMPMQESWTPEVIEQSLESLKYKDEDNE